jgi:Na+/proline symporter
MFDSPIVAERRRTILSGASNAVLFFAGAIILAVVMIAAVLVVFLSRPDNPNMVLINLILTVMGGLIASSLGAAGIGVVKVMNGHNTRMMTAIARMSRAEGKIEGLRENPNTNIE